MRRVFCFLALLLVAFASTPAVADCIDPTSVTSWSLQGSNTILLYRGNKLHAVITVPWCVINPASRIAFDSSLLCPFGTIWIDGSKCTVTKVCKVD